MSGKVIIYRHTQSEKKQVFVKVQEEQKVSPNLKLLLQYYKPHKKLLFLDTLFAVIGAGIAVLIPMIIRYITDEVVNWEANSALTAIAVIVLGLIAMTLVEMYCNYFIAYYGHIMGAKMEYTMRNELFSHYQKLSFSFYDKQRIGQLMSRVTNDLFDISELLHHAPEEIIVSTIKLLGTLAVLCAINWRLALIAFAPVPFMIWFAIKYNKRMKKAFVNNRAKIAEINSTMEDSLSGIRVVKSFANEDVEIDKFLGDNARFVTSKERSYHYMGVYHSVLGLLATIITIAVAGGGAALMVAGYLKMTDLLVFLIYIRNFIEPIRKLAMLTEQFQNGISGFERFRQMMDIEPDIMDSDNAQQLTDVKGDIAFKKVSFYYDESGYVIRDLSLDIPAGQFIAVVGASGVGKTTLCGLIPRFYDVSEGSITIDGKDIRNFTLKSLRDHIGIVQQDVYLFTDTVMENIRYGKPSATDEEIIEAAKRANAHDFIQALPDGYDTEVGQRGARFSGGQKQRISIARVFLKNPPILIFDEATSALDNESEKVIRESLEELAKNRTTLVIAHRLSTTHNAERILLLTADGIAEEGTHRELMSLNGQYASLYSVSAL